MHWSDVAYSRSIRLTVASCGHEKSRTPFSRGTRLFVLFALQSGDVRLCSFPRLQKSVDELRSEAIIKGEARHSFALEKPEHCVV